MLKASKYVIKPTPEQVTYLRKDLFKNVDSFIFKGKRGEYLITTNQIINYVWWFFEQ